MKKAEGKTGFHGRVVKKAQWRRRKSKRIAGVVAARESGTIPDQMCVVPKVQLDRKKCGTGATGWYVNTNTAYQCGGRQKPMGDA